MSKKHFFAGTFLLSTVGVISRIMGFFYRIFLSQTIGSRGIGLYQLVVPLQHMVLAVTTSGIQTALSRTVASQTALKQKKKQSILFVSAHFLRSGFLLQLCGSFTLSPDGLPERF